MNKVIHKVQVVSNPEQRYTTNNVVIQSFKIKVDEISIFAYLIGKAAKPELQNGDEILLSGRLITTQKDNVKTYSIEGDNLIILGKSQNTYTNPDFGDVECGDDLIGEDEIPF